MNAGSLSGIGCASPKRWTAVAMERGCRGFREPERSGLATPSSGLPGTPAVRRLAILACRTGGRHSAGVMTALRRDNRCQAVTVANVEVEAAVVDWAL